MTWTRLDDNFSDLPTVAELSDAAFRVHVEALVYCNRLLTNGRLPRSQLRKVTAVDAPDLAVAELEQQGLWTAIEGDDAWQVDWSGQEAADVVSSRKAQNAERQRRFKRHRAGLHDLCDPSRCPGTEQVTGEVTRYPTREKTRQVTREETRPRPVPTRPDPKESGRGRGPTSSLKCAHGAPLAGDDRSGCARCVEEQSEQLRLAAAASAEEAS